MRLGFPVCAGDCRGTTAQSEIVHWRRVANANIEGENGTISRRVLSDPWRCFWKGETSANRSSIDRGCVMSPRPPFTLSHRAAGTPPHATEKGKLTFPDRGKTERACHSLPAAEVPSHRFVAHPFHTSTGTNETCPSAATPLAGSGRLPPVRDELPKNTIVGRLKWGRSRLPRFASFGSSGLPHASSVERAGGIP